jgi:hypothetical protein
MIQKSKNWNSKIKNQKTKTKKSKIQKTTEGEGYRHRRQPLPCRRRKAEQRGGQAILGFFPACVD